MAAQIFMARLLEQPCQNEVCIKINQYEYFKDYQ